MDAAQRERVLDAAAIEILRSGYPGATLSAIAAHLGLTKGALARDFPSKDRIRQEILEHLERILRDEHTRSLAVYPDSPIRALVRYLLQLGLLSVRNVRMQAGLVLFADRSSTSPLIPELMDLWVDVLTDFCIRAEDQGELDDQVSPSSLGEYLFVTTLGEGTYGFHAYRPEHAQPRMRFLRFTLKAAGVQHIDEVIDEVIRTLGNGSMNALPPSLGVARGPK